MPFPVSARGTVIAESADLSEAILAVEMMLRRAKARNIAVEAHRINFTAGIFRLVTSWNLLGPVSYGSIDFREIERGVEVRYRLSFLQMLVIVSVMVVFLFGLYPVIFWGPYAGAPLPLLLLTWLWLFGSNYVLTLFRFPSALRSALQALHATPVATSTANQSAQRTAPRSDA